MPRGIRSAQALLRGAFHHAEVACPRDEAGSSSDVCSPIRRGLQGAEQGARSCLLVARRPLYDVPLRAQPQDTAKGPPWAGRGARRAVAPDVEVLGT